MNASILEFIPILLACVAIVTCSLKFGFARRKMDRILAVAGTIAATLLIIAQTSFWALMNNPGYSTFIPDAIWTVFNTLVMLILILGSTPRK